jgi:hypothetical protein
VSMELAGSFMTRVRELRPAQQVAILQVLMPWIEQTERLATGSSTLSEVREARFAGGLSAPGANPWRSNETAQPRTRMAS